MSRAKKNLDLLLTLTLLMVSFLPVRAHAGERAVQAASLSSQAKTHPDRIGVSSSTTARREGVSAVPKPLPHGCGGVAPSNPDACCAYGYIYYDDEPVAGASVRIESPHGVLTTITTSGLESDHPYYGVDLSSSPLLVSPGDTITITASYGGMTSARTWTAQSHGQHVDLGLVAGYQE